MKLMICDDNGAELENIKAAVSRYAAAHPETSLLIRCFSNPFDMLDEIHKNGAPDIALLDICMPGILGTEVAREILSGGEENTDIIFLTTSSDFAVEAFSLRAYDYLTKPYTESRLNDTLERVFEKRRDRDYVTVSCGKEIHRINVYKVLYIEAKNHGAEIHLTSGKCLKTYTTLTELRTLFLEKTNAFIAVGASYIINLNHVKSLLAAELEMSNGDLIPVPRRLRGETKKLYFDFYTREATGK